MNSALYESDYLALPLLANAESTLNPQPNFLVIQNIQGRTKAELPVLGDTVCAFAHYRITYREILEASEELGRSEEMREVVFETAYSQPVPIIIVPALADYAFLKAKIADVNQMLSLFSFRGVLAGFQLIIDEDALDEILLDVYPPTEE